MKKTKIMTKNGYSTLLVSNHWKIAVSVASEDEYVKDISRHNETDESFILLDGDGYLITAKENNESFSFRFHKMIKGEILTIERNEWHAHLWKAGTQVLIVENSDTSDSNSDKHILTDEERAVVNTADDIIS